MTAEKDGWYWDLVRQKAVRYLDRGPGDQTLGPYATKFEAENWKAKSEERNDAWDAADEEWDSAGSNDG